MAVTLEEAIEAARRSYPDDQWLSLTPRQQTKLIYEEMRRLDLARSGASSAQPSPTPVLPSSMRAGTRQCMAVVRSRTNGRCAWRASVMRNGKFYCGFHARLEDMQEERRCEPTAAD
jgi:hypothetical protein